jgi:hypothetical protein
LSNGQLLDFDPEAFLGTCLGGRIEPVGDDFSGSSLEVLVGKEYIPGVEQALR